MRARWIIDYGENSREKVEPFLRQAIALVPDEWEPWSLLADTVHDDAALRLHCVERAVRLGGGPVLERQLASLLHLFDRFSEAEHALTAVIERKDTEPFFISLSKVERATARVQLGAFAGAVSDMADAPASAHYREPLGQYQWLAGDFAGAHLTFTAQLDDWVPDPSPQRMRIWAHLCQVAHGLRNSAMPPQAGSDERPPISLSGVCVSPWQEQLRDCPHGPPQRAVWIWHALTDLFLDRVTPVELLAASQAALAESDAWRFPATLEGTHISFLDRPEYVWRSQLLFYIGMWHLSKGDVECAGKALSEASCSDESRSLEKLAAREQLQRLAGSATASVTPFRPLEAAPPPPPPLPHSHLQKFVDLQITLPELWPTRAGPTLKFDAHNLGDEGLATLVASRNLRFVTRLLLQDNGITAAGMAAFRKSGHIVNLSELDLSGNPIGDDGVGHLVSSAALLALESLDLSNTCLTDAGAQLLVSQQLLRLNRLVLGGTPVDMPVWRRLIARYGSGLYSHGVFKTPYDPPFEPDLQVCFTSTAGFATGGGLMSRRRELTFLMRDYVAWLWQRAAAARHKTGQWDPLTQVAKVHDFERTLVAWTARVYAVESRDGITMLHEGCRPLFLRCPHCEVRYVWPKVEIEPGAPHTPDVIKCPKGHQLN